jgi:RNA polymerase sigma factor (sigma-70 family)
MTRSSDDNTDPRHETLEQFLERYYAKLIHYVRTKVPEPDAHDLVQDCLTVIVDKRATIENFKAYTFKVVCNKLKQYYERRARRAGIVGIIYTEQAMSVESLSTSLSIRVARRNDLEQAMQKLPLRQYQAFELRYVEGLDEQATADALEISRATLKRDLTTARARLASVLGVDHDDDALRRIVADYIRT